MEPAYVIGVDFGSDSVRAILLNAATGAEAGVAECPYPRWAKGLYQQPEKQVFRQHPLDYTEALTACIQSLVAPQPAEVRAGIRAMAVATTGSTPCPVDEAGTPLALQEAFADSPNAMFHLWKDHSAAEEALALDAALKSFDGTDYTATMGRYSAEWFWAKILHTSRTDPTIAGAAASWVEHSDWMPALLTGKTAPHTLYSSACAAGHKALWHSAWGGLPPRECLASFHPALGKVYDSFAAPKPADTAVGLLTPRWAQRLGLPAGVVVGGSSFDSHAGGVGAGVAPGTMVSSVGTSCVSLLVAEASQIKAGQITDICGLAENSIIPGLTGIETGQAAFGDVYAWFGGLLQWPLRQVLGASGLVDDALLERLAGFAAQNTLPMVEQAAANLEAEDGLVALDWLNGRRYPNASDTATGAVAALTLGSSAPGIYRALARATVFGFRRIYEGLRAHGVPIQKIITVGGIARKSGYIMQMMADALGCPIHACQGRQAIARGAAIYAAAAAGLYPSIPTAQQALCEREFIRFEPGAHRAETEVQYHRYLGLCGLFE